MQTGRIIIFQSNFATLGWEKDYTYPGIIGMGSKSANLDSHDIRIIFSGDHTADVRVDSRRASTIIFDGKFGEIVLMTNKLQQTFTILSRNFYKNSRQRRESIAQAQAILAQGEDLLTAVIFFVVFILPFLFNPNLLFNLSDWLWWVRGHAWMGLLVWILLRLLVTLPLAPAQLTGAAVDAMEQATPADDVPVFFPATPVEIECEPLSLPPDTAEQKAGRQAYWLQQWRRPGRRLLFGLLIRRHHPLPPLSLEPSA